MAAKKNSVNVAIAPILSELDGILNKITKMALKAFLMFSLMFFTYVFMPTGCINSLVSVRVNTALHSNYPGSGDMHLMSCSNKSD